MGDRGKRIVLFIVAVCVVGAVWYVAYYRSVQRSIRSLGSRIAVQREQVDKGSRTAVTVSGLERQAEEAWDELTLRKAALPRLDALPDLTERLMELADPLGLRLIAAEPQDVTSEGIQGKAGVATLRIQLHVEGPFLSVGRFLEDLADLPFFAGFGEFSCRREGGRSSVTAILETFVYVLERESLSTEPVTEDSASVSATNEG